MSSKNILVVEDDSDIREMLVFNLVREGYHTEEAENGLVCLEKIKQKKPDLILLDVMMPEMDGLTAFKEYNRQATIPTIFLTAKGEELDRVVGLELGAEDYVIKPFSIRELMLRIKNVFRRGNVSPAQTISEETLYKRGGLTLDKSTHKVFIDEKEIAVTLTEFRLLEDLLRHAGFVRSREQLLETVWGYQFDGYNRTVDTHVRRLRQKLEKLDNMLETVRGLGYRIK